MWQRRGQRLKWLRKSFHKSRSMPDTECTLEFSRCFPIALADAGEDQRLQRSTFPCLFFCFLECSIQTVGRFLESADLRIANFFT